MTETVAETACRILENLTVILQSGTFPGYMAGEIAESRKFISAMLEKSRLDQEALTPKSEPTDDEKIAAAAVQYDFVTDGELPHTYRDAGSQPVKRKRGRPRKAK